MLCLRSSFSELVLHVTGTAKSTILVTFESSTSALGLSKFYLENKWLGGYEPSPCSLSIDFCCINHIAEKSWELSSDRGRFNGNSFVFLASCCADPKGWGLRHRSHTTPRSTRRWWCPLTKIKVCECIKAVCFTTLNESDFLFVWIHKSAIHRIYSMLILHIFRFWRGIRRRRNNEGV